MYQLEGEYLDTYERVELYAALRNMNKRVSDEMLGDLYDLLISAQKDGRKVEKIIGSDLALFCKDYFSEYDMKARLSEIPETLFIYVIFIFLFETVCMIIDQTSMSDARINWFPYICGISTAFVTQLLARAVVKPLLFRFRKVRTIIYDMIILSIFIGSLFLTGVLVNVTEFNMPAFPVMLVSGAYIVLFIAVRCIVNMKRFGQLRRPKSIYKRPLLPDKEQFNAELYAAFKEQMLKRYNRKNKKRIKNGKGELHTEEYIAMIKRDIDKMPFVWRIMKIFYAMLIAFPVCWNFADYLAEGNIQSAVIESAILCAVLMVILVPCYRMCKKNDERGAAMRLSVIEEAERCNMDLIEYLENGPEGEKAENGDNLIKFSN